jgi:hypothetical protein
VHRSAPDRSSRKLMKHLLEIVLYDILIIDRYDCPIIIYPDSAVTHAVFPLFYNAISIKLLIIREFC